MPPSILVVGTLPGDVLEEAFSTFERLEYTTFSFGGVAKVAWMLPVDSNFSGRFSQIYEPFTLAEFLCSTGLAVEELCVEESDEESGASDAGDAECDACGQLVGFCECGLPGRSDDQQYPSLYSEIWGAEDSRGRKRCGGEDFDD